MGHMGFVGTLLCEYYLAYSMYNNLWLGTKFYIAFKFCVCREYINMVSDDEAMDNSALNQSYSPTPPPVSPLSPVDQRSYHIKSYSMLYILLVTCFIVCGNG